MNSRSVRSVLDTIGNTPLFRLGRMSSAEIFGKAEFLNPGGSIKDRVARHLIQQAEAEGVLRPGMTIVEATSGNTGIGVALVAAQRGYAAIIVMPENMSEERKKIITALGAEVILTPASESLDGCLRVVSRLVAERGAEVWVPRQFSNPHNPGIHHATTGPEIWEAMEGRVDVFVAGVGSGGTLQGVGSYLKEMNPDVRVVAVEPRNASALLGREPGLHQIQGIGDGFIPDVLDVHLVDMVITVTDDQAIQTTRLLAMREGLLVGTSSGANVWAAMELASGSRRVVTVLPDRAERYFSTALL
ncbi:MAG: cysteine synthase A [Deltaproteobacteria bacterium]|nr:cysteine synthase A [Deltaproteobacteria bacterium]